MRRLPPLGSLRAFEAAARLLSFRLAAQELGLTPTAISHQVRLLEAYCGGTLFRRRPRPLALTPAGAALFPVLRDGFDSFGATLSLIRSHAGPTTLRVTTTNAFASRWLVPRLGKWRAERPDVDLSIIGTDRILSLDAGEADLAIRYARDPPPGAGDEIFRDRFFPICSPKLLDGRPPLSGPASVLDYPLIHFDWYANDRTAPTWETWLKRGSVHCPPRFALTFKEETHAIEAAVAGQGIILCSEIVVADDLASGRLVKAMDLSLEGFGFFPVFLPIHPSFRVIEAFLRWLTSLAEPTR